MSVPVTVNGDPQEIAADLKITELLHSLDITSGPVAVEVNGEIVPRSEHANYQLKANDKIEIVQAIGGG